MTICHDGFKKNCFILREYDDLIQPNFNYERSRSKRLAPLTVLPQYILYIKTIKYMKLNKLHLLSYLMPVIYTQ